MVKIFKNYSTEKQRTTPILSVDGKPMGFLASRDAIAIISEDRQNPWRRDIGSVLESRTFSDGSTIQRTFQLVHWKSELFQVSWDGTKPCDPTIKATTRAAFEALMDQYNHDSRWTRA